MKTYIVRHYDGFDNEWVDISEPCSLEQAKKVLAEKTDGGKHATSFNDIDYYRIFESDTIMHYSEEGRCLSGRCRT